jgi:hypothetical protein
MDARRYAKTSVCGGKIEQLSADFGKDTAKLE